MIEKPAISPKAEIKMTTQSKPYEYDLQTEKNIRHNTGIKHYSCKEENF